MSNTHDDHLTIQDLRAGAYRFFSEFKGELEALEGDFDTIDRELAALDSTQEKITRHIHAIEEEAIRHMDKELIDILNDADNEASVA